MKRLLCARPRCTALTSQCASMNYLQSRSEISAVYNVAGTGLQTRGTCWCPGETGAESGTTIGSDPGNDVGLIQ